MRYGAEGIVAYEFGVPDAKPNRTIRISGPPDGPSGTNEGSASKIHTLYLWKMPWHGSSEFRFFLGRFVATTKLGRTASDPNSGAGRRSRVTVTVGQNRRIWHRGSLYNRFEHAWRPRARATVPRPAVDTTNDPINGAMLP
jgi:hypothetical protein